MARLTFGMNQSLDGFVDHDRFAPDPLLFRHFVDKVGGLTGSIYGRTLYGLMRYWDDDQLEWGHAEHEFAKAWRQQHKWVVSSTLGEVGPNATLIVGDLEASVRTLKAEQPGEIELGGPKLAGRLAELGLIDEYQIYLHPVVLGWGTRFFAEARPPLHLIAHERIGPEAIRLTYVPT